MTGGLFDRDDPKVSAATLELLLRLDGLTARLENAVIILERTIGDGDDDD